MLTAVRNHAEVFKPVFVRLPAKPLDAISVGRMFTVQYTSEEDSNKRKQENRILSYWADLLQDLGGKFSHCWLQKQLF